MEEGWEGVGRWAAPTVVASLVAAVRVVVEREVEEQVAEMRAVEGLVEAGWAA